MKGNTAVVLTYPFVFFVGMIIGSVLVESLEVYMRPTYTDIHMAQIRMRQERLASRAAYENRTFEAALHRWAAVNAQADDGFRAFDPNDSGLHEIDEKSYFLPFRVLFFERMYPGWRAGEKIVEGTNRGRLAVSLEEIGQTKEAQKQWELAQKLTKQPTIEATKEAFYKMEARSE